MAIPRARPCWRMRRGSRGRRSPMHGARWNRNKGNTTIATWLWRRYLELIDHVMAVLAEADVRVLLVGVEVDALLGDNDEAWEDYAAFTATVASYVHTIRPGVEVGVQSTTYSRIVDSARWAAIDASTDIIATSYYPLDGLMVRDPAEIAGDFDTLSALYPDRIIRIV